MTGVQTCALPILLAKGMPIDLADILRVSDEKDIEPVLTRLGDYAKSVNKDNNNKDNKPTGFQLGAPTPKNNEQVDPYRKAMGL